MSAREINVVVVGGSWAGVKAIRTLLNLVQSDYPNLRITLVERRAHYFHITGAIRGMVDPSYAQRMCIPYDRMFSTAGIPNANHTFIQGTLAQVHSRFIDLESGQRIFFDYLILSTGSQYHSLPVVQSTHYHEAQELFASMRASIQRAKRILVVGGGAVGVGLCGEIADHYPDKKLTIGHNRKHLLNGDLADSFASSAETKLTRMGVRLMLGETVMPSPNSPRSFMTPDTLEVFTTKSGKTIECDLVIWTTGGRPETCYMSTLVPSNWERPLVDAVRSRIHVRPTLQLDDDLYPHIFAIGDCNTLPDSEKYVAKACAQAKLAAINIRLMMDEGFDSRVRLSVQAGHEALTHARLLPYFYSRNNIVVPLGKKRGVTEAWGLRFGDFATRSKKGRDYMIGKAAKLLNY